ncbi:MAG: hypothetical protein ACFB10_16945 [Salibacteraceae bacterium]
MQQFRRRHHASNSRLLFIIGALAFVIIIYVSLPLLVPRLMEKASGTSDSTSTVQEQGVEVELAPADSTVK